MEHGTWNTEYGTADDDANSIGNVLGGWRMKRRGKSRGWREQQNVYGGITRRKAGNELPSQIVNEEGTSSSDPAVQLGERHMGPLLSTLSHLPTMIFFCLSVKQQCLVRKQEKQLNHNDSRKHRTIFDPSSRDKTRTLPTTGAATTHRYISRRWVLSTI